MIFDKIIKDLLQLNFFSEYKFRKRDSSFLLKTKGGKQFIEMDHWIDEATSSLVIYPIYGVRFDILSKWFEKFSMKNLQDQRDRASIAFSGDMLSMQDKFYFNLNGEKYATDFNELQAKVQKCAEYVFSEYSSLDKLYDKTIVPILNGEVSLPDVGADWIFIDLALCKIVNPSNFPLMKVQYNLNESKKASQNFDKILGASSHYDYKIPARNGTTKTRNGSRFDTSISHKLILKSRTK